MSISITPGMINHFTDPKQMRAHSQMKKIEKDVNLVLDAFQRMDNSDQDGNIASDTVVLDRAYLSYSRGSEREIFSDMTGALLKNSEGTQFEASVNHRQEQTMILPYPETSRGQLSVSMKETPESVIYQSPEGQYSLDKATGVRTIHSSF